MSAETTGLYEYKYTDRDVREDARLKPLAIRYVRGYGGSFEPLLKAKKMLAAKDALTVAMTRTVLNCMRNDWAAALELPTPTRTGQPEEEEEEMADVIPMKPECDITTPHRPHILDAPGKPWCDGFDLGRRPVVTMPVRIKRRLATGKTGHLIHIVDADSDKNVVRWLTKKYEPGFNEANLVVKTLCKTPSVLYSAILPAEETAQLMMRNGLRIPCENCLEIARMTQW